MTDNDNSGASAGATGEPGADVKALQAQIAELTTKLDAVSSGKADKPADPGYKPELVEQQAAFYSKNGAGWEALQARVSELSGGSAAGRAAELERKLATRDALDEFKLDKKWAPYLTARDEAGIFEQAKGLSELLSEVTKHGASAGDDQDDAPRPGRQRLPDYGSGKAKDPVDDLYRQAARSAR